MKMMKSYKFWVALSGAVGLFITSLSKILGFEISSEGVSEVIMAFCGVLIVFGIVSKPSEDKKMGENMTEIEIQSTKQSSKSEEDLKQNDKKND